MINRRTFIKNTGALAIGGSLLSTASWSQASPRPIGLQLYTLMSTIDADLDGTLKKVAALGFTEIESAFSMKGGYYGLKPKEFAAKAKGFGLEWRAHHVLGAPFKLPPGAKLPTGPDGKPITIPPMKTLTESRQELVDQAAEGGVKYLVCANTPINTADEIKTSIDVLNKTAEACKKAGIGLAFHNHDAEFKSVEGMVPYMMFLTQFDPEIKMELDLAWATKAGIDPVTLFKLHPGRFPLWHVKDIDSEFKGPQPVGKGVVDFKRIFANAELAGLQHFFVEHDMPADPMGSIETSINYLKTIL